MLENLATETATWETIGEQVGMVGREGAQYNPHRYFTRSVRPGSTAVKQQLLGPNQEATWRFVSYLLTLGNQETRIW